MKTTRPLLHGGGNKVPAGAALVFCLWCLAGCGPGSGTGPGSRPNPGPKPVSVKLGGLERIPETGSWSQTVYEALAVSPDGNWIGISGFDGRIRLMDRTGKQAWSQGIPEGVGRSAVFSQDSKTLFAGECGMDGALYAINVETGKRLWTYKAAKDLGRPASDQAPSWSRQPCIYNLARSGDKVLAIGVFSRRETIKLEDGRGIVSYPTSALLYAFDPGGSDYLWRYPAGETMDTRAPVALFLRGRNLAAIANTSWRKEGEPEEKYPNGTLRLIDADSGRELFSMRIMPEFFSYTSLWYGLTASENGDWICAAVNDGRIFLFRVKPGPQLELAYRKEVTTPIQVSGIPIYAGANMSQVFDGGEALVVTGNTFAARAADSGAQQEPPGAHPDANSVFLFDAAGETLWKWKCPGAVNDLTVDPVNGYFVLSVGHNYIEGETGAPGFHIFRIRGSERKSVQQIGYFGLDGIAIRAAMPPAGGYFAGLEAPIKHDDHTVTGAHRLHIIPLELFKGER